MFDYIVHIIRNGVLFLALAILTVDGSKNLDNFTGHILLRISIPFIALGSLFAIRDYVKHYDND